MKPTRNAVPQTAATAPRRADPVNVPCIKFSDQLLQVDDVELCHGFNNEAEVEQEIMSKRGRQLLAPKGPKDQRYVESGMALVYTNSSRGKKEQWYFGGATDGSSQSIAVMITTPEEME